MWTHRSSLPFPRLELWKGSSSLLSLLAKAVAIKLNCLPFWDILVIFSEPKELTMTKMEKIWPNWRKESVVLLATNHALDIAISNSSVKAEEITRPQEVRLQRTGIGSTPWFWDSFKRFRFRIMLGTDWNLCHMATSSGAGVMLHVQVTSARVSDLLLPKGQPLELVGTGSNYFPRSLWTRSSAIPRGMRIYAYQQIAIQCSSGNEDCLRLPAPETCGDSRTGTRYSMVGTRSFVTPLCLLELTGIRTPS